MYTYSTAANDVVTIDYYTLCARSINLPVLKADQTWLKTSIRRYIYFIENIKTAPAGHGAWRLLYNPLLRAYFASSHIKLGSKLDYRPTSGGRLYSRGLTRIYGLHCFRRVSASLASLPVPPPLRPSRVKFRFFFRVVCSCSARGVHKNLDVYSICHSLWTFTRVGWRTAVLYCCSLSCKYNKSLVLNVIIYSIILCSLS